MMLRMTPQEPPWMCVSVSVELDSVDHVVEDEEPGETCSSGKSGEPLDSRESTYGHLDL